MEWNGIAMSRPAPNFLVVSKRWKRTKLRNELSDYGCTYTYKGNLWAGGGNAVTVRECYGDFFYS